MNTKLRDVIQWSPSMQYARFGYYLKQIVRVIKCDEKSAAAHFGFGQLNEEPGLEGYIVTQLSDGFSFWVSKDVIDIGFKQFGQFETNFFDGIKPV